MLNSIRAEFISTVKLTVFVVLASILVYFAVTRLIITTPSSSSTDLIGANLPRVNSNAENDTTLGANQGNLRAPVTLTGQYEATMSGVTLLVESLRISPVDTTVVYALVKLGETDPIVPQAASVVGDGRSYRSLSNTFIGNAGGVSVWILSAESLDGKSSTLALDIEGAVVAGQALDDSLVVDFARVSGLREGWSAGIRVAPEVVDANGVRIGLASSPGDSFLRLLMDESGARSSVFGRLTEDDWVSLSSAEWLDAFTVERGYTPPEVRSDWPTAGFAEEAE